MAGVPWLMLLLGCCIWAMDQIFVAADTDPNDRELELGIFSLLP
jgi:hypothetical protein